MDSVTIDGVVFERQKPQTPIRIVVMDRGFIVVGRVDEVGDYIVITDAKCVRRWGTTGGLGQLATGGPLNGTVLDRQPTTRVHKLQVVQIIDCEDEKWKL